ncbi:MAG: DotU family type IV/VI secretion system protein, partial [Desulfovibrio sp.]|nr:DotU family type IV/VI secretion system protein [Desulfovibrio sp.]
PMPLEEIHKQLIILADEERSQPLEGICDQNDPSAGKDDLDDARFAVYAWVDEKLLNADRADASAWLPLSLQYHYFSTAEAGAQFFCRLNKLLDKIGIRREDGETTFDLAMRFELAQSFPQKSTEMGVVRIFALCLLYGFRGELFGQEEVLLRLRKVCLTLLHKPKIVSKLMPLPPKKKGSFLYCMETAAYVFVPVVCCALFWFFCANLLAHIPVKGF